MRNRQQVIIFNSMLIAAILALYTYHKWDSWFSAQDIMRSDVNLPDLTAVTVKQDNFDQDGNKEYELRAESMLQYLASDRNLMIRPDITLFQDRVATWQTSSAEAVSDSEGEELHLTGNVIIKQVNFAEKGLKEAPTLETDTLLLRPKESFATTDDKVIIRQSGIYIEATGLEADLNTNRITLREKVTSIYEPDKS